MSRLTWSRSISSSSSRKPIQAPRAFTRPALAARGRSSSPPATTRIGTSASRSNASPRAPASTSTISSGRQVCAATDASARARDGRPMVRTTMLTSGGDAVEFMGPNSKGPNPMRRLLALALAALLAACTVPSTTSTGIPAAAKPRLVVFLVVDGLPQRQVVDYRDQLAHDGLARFLDRGAWFADAHYGHAFTVTGAGHAAMLTGAYPHRTGIIGNDWRDNATGE